MTEEFENEVVIDKRLFNKWALHKLANNGGSIKFNNFGLRVVYDANNPQNQFVELRLFAVPVGTIYQGNINPSLARAAATKAKAEAKAEVVTTEEEGVEEL